VSQTGDGNRNLIRGGYAATRRTRPARPGQHSCAMYAWAIPSATTRLAFANQDGWFGLQVRNGCRIRAMPCGVSLSVLRGEALCGMGERFGLCGFDPASRARTRCAPVPIDTCCSAPPDTPHPPCPEARGGCTSTRLSHTPHEKLGKRNALSWIRTCLGWHVLRKIVDLKDHAWRCGAAATHHRRGQPQRRIAVSCRLTLLLQLRRRRQSRKVMPARNAPPATLHMSSFGSSVLRYNACFTLALPMRRRHHSDTSTFHVRARLCIWGANLCVSRTSQSFSAHHQEANIIQK
jgi:hypothetical protein